jgi:L-asparaginase II
VKGGAEGLLAAARDGYGVAVKAEAGSAWVAAAAMMEAMRRLGALSPTAQNALDDVAGPAVYGGGRQVGRVAVRPAE